MILAWFGNVFGMVWQGYWHGLARILAWFGKVFGMVWQGFLYGLARFLAWFGNVWLRFYVEEGGRGGGGA